MSDYRQCLERDFSIASALFCLPSTDNTEIVLNVAIHLDFVEYGFHFTVPNNRNLRNLSCSNLKFKIESYKKLFYKSKKNKTEKDRFSNPQIL